MRKPLPGQLSFLEWLPCEPDPAEAPAPDEPAGFVGLLTANSFMKREFGKKLVEDFFPGVDLTHVIDTSGAYIPGHGTPTVILLGRNRPPASGKIRAILGIKGEPSTPADPAKGLVWRSILDQLYGPDRGTDLFDRIPEWAANRHAGDLLGDLYQQQSEDARKGRALVQTPPFARTLLLRETLGRSLEVFGLEATRFCDPACGTGHLLVDAFRILYRAAESLHPEWLSKDVAQYALDRIVGCDLDPACTAIATFRLVQAAWDEAGWPGVTFHTQLYTGDSLLHHRPRPGDRLDDEMVEALEAGRFTAVAANPPYIVSPSRAKAQAYRDRYASAYRQFSLGCPFTELCWSLAKREGQRALPDIGDAPLVYPSEAFVRGLEV